MIEIEFLELSNGRCPVQEFLDGLDHKTYKKIEKMFDMFEENPLAYIRDPELFPKMDGYEKYKLREFRVFYNKTYYRIFACLAGQTCWLLHAIVKKDKKTRSSDLTTAVNRITDYNLLSK